MIRETSCVPNDVGTFASLSFGDAALDAPVIRLSLKNAGDMWGGGASESNRDAFYRAVGFSSERVRTLRQIHSRRVVVAEEVAEDVEADGLVARDPSVSLAVRVADCFPIFLYDSVSGAFAALHSGWKGTGIVVEALRLMRSRYGTKSPDVHAVLGPGIRSCCYNVDDERARGFEADFGSSSVVRRNGNSYLDLASANISLLESEGVRDVTSVTDCTSCSPYLGSFRREGAENFTHMLAVIGYLR